MFIYLIEVTGLLIKRGPAKNRPKDGGSDKCVRSHNLESAAGTLCRRLGYAVRNAEISERKRVDAATFTGVLKKKGRYDEEYIKVANVKVSQVLTKGG